MKKILRYCVLVGVFIIPFISLIVTNSLFFPFITGKNFTFRIAVEIAFAAWAVLAVADASYRPRRSWILYSLAAFVGVMAIADAMSPNPFKSFWSNFERMEGWVTLAHLLAYFVVASTVLAKEKLWDAFFQTTLGVNGVIIVYSLLQLTRLIPIEQSSTRIDATLGNAAYAGMYAVFNIFIAALYLVRNRHDLKTYKNGFLALGFNVGFFAFVLPNIQIATHGTASGTTAILWAFIAWILFNLALYTTSVFEQERYVYGVLILLDMVMLYYSATRGAILGFIAGVFVAACVVAYFRKEKDFVKKGAYGVLIASVVVVVAFLVLRNTNIVRNSQVLNRFATISLSETTTLSRFKLWNMAIIGVKERPIFGWGQESFNYIFNSKYDPALYGQEQWFDRTHNVILDWLVAGGVFGLITYLALYVSVAFALLRPKNHVLFTPLEKGILSGVLVAYFIHNLFVFDNITSYVMFFSIAAFVYFRTTPHVEQTHSQAISNRMILPVAAVALIATVYAVNIRPIAANLTLLNAMSAPVQAGDVSGKADLFKKALAYNTFGDQETREQLVTFGTQVANAIGQQQQVKGASEFLALASSEAKKQFSLTPLDARAYALAGAFFAQTGDAQNAREALETAHKLSPKKQTIDFALGSILIAQNKYADALVIFKEAYDLAPQYTAARLYYAAAAVYNHKLDVADTVLKGIDPTVIAGSNDLMAAYYTTKQYKQLLALWQIRTKIDPASAQNHVSLAAAYILAGDRKSAIAEINEAIKLEPSFKEQGNAYINEIKAGKSL